MAVLMGLSTVVVGGIMHDILITKFLSFYIKIYATSCIVGAFHYQNLKNFLRYIKENTILWDKYILLMMI